MPAGNGHALVLALILVTACEPPRPGPTSAKIGARRCRYAVQVEDARPLLLRARVDCQGGPVRGLAAADQRIFDHVEMAPGARSEAMRAGASFRLPAPTSTTSLTYDVDLEGLADSTSDFDYAERFGDAVIAPASSFLLYPLPLDVNTEVSLRLSVPSTVGFASGLDSDGDGYRLLAHEIPVATYSVFGRFDQRRLNLDPETAIDVVVLGKQGRLSTDAMLTWIELRARAMARFWDGFPSPHLLIAVMLLPHRQGVLFGKLLPESAPGIALMVGAKSELNDLGDDWILVHELFHIGVPSFYREGKWLDEGLATYYEPLIRARAGLLDEQRLWQEMARDLPQGLDALTRTGLEHARGYTGRYWGGALFCLAADVTARLQSGGRFGLEDGLRRVRRAGGQASEVWSLSDVLREADGAFTSPVLEPLARRYAKRPADFDLDRLLGDLGVERTSDGIVLRDDARLAWVRKVIVWGPDG